MQRSTLMKLATAAIAIGLSASNASAATYIFSIADDGGPTYSFNLDSTLGVSPGTKGLTTNFSNVAYTTNGVASGTTSVSFSGRNITLDPFFIIVSGDLPGSSFAIGSGPTVSFSTGTFRAYDPFFNGSLSNNVTLTVSTRDVVTGAVPEPATWAMMIGGFGLIGGTMRRRRTAVRFA